MGGGKGFSWSGHDEDVYRDALTGIDRRLQEEVDAERLELDFALIYTHGLRIRVDVMQSLVISRSHPSSSGVVLAV